VDDAIAHHDILICPYEEASQSGIIAEAQADGMPAVVTPVGGLAEQIGYGLAGWPAATATAADLSLAIRKAIEDNATYHKKSAAALRMVGQTIGATPWAEIVQDMTKA
jgi:glycosyltransferase involved in cell wall biosynthesis